MDIRKLSFVCIGLFIGITSQGSNTDKTLVAWVEINDVSVRKNPNIKIFTKDKDLFVKEIHAWKMKSIY